MSTSLTLRGGQLPDASEWKTLMEMADVFMKSGLLPSSIKSPAAAVLIMAKGRELSIPPVHALSSIVIIQGKPAASSELMASLVYRDHGDDALRFTETNATKCTISYKRRSWTARESYSFTIQDAEAAGLMANDTWRKYRPAMLRARCISAVARMAFPDTIGGLYTPEELGASVSVSDFDEPTIHIPQSVIPTHSTTGTIDVHVHPATGEIVEESNDLEDAIDPWNETRAPSSEERAKVQAREVAEMAQPITSVANGEGLTQAQLRAIYAISRGKKGMSEQQIEQMCVAQYRVKPSELTKRQASSLIDGLQKEAATAGAGT